MPIINNLTDITDVYLGTTKITDVYAGSTKVMSQAPQEIPWTQPVLTSNGTMGGSSFAVYTPYAAQGTQPYQAFDRNGTRSGCLLKGSSPTDPIYLEWYNPKPLKITNIRTFFNNMYPVCSIKIQASNIDSSNPAEWEEIFNDGYDDSHVYEMRDYVSIDINDSRRFKYWKIFRNVGLVTEYVYFMDIQITATELA